MTRDHAQKMLRAELTRTERARIAAERGAITPPKVTTPTQGRTARSAPPVCITINRTRNATSADVVAAVVDALGHAIADSLERFVSDRLAAGQPVTHDELRDTREAPILRALVVTRMLLNQRSTPAALLLRSLETRSRPTPAPPPAPAPVPQVTVIAPDFVEVETTAKFDQAGRMIGTVTKKARVK